MNSTFVDTFKLIRDECKKTVKNAQLDHSAVKLGFNLEKLVLKDPEFLPMTPYLKTSLHQTKELDEGDKKIRVSANTTTAEVMIIQDTYDIICEVFGKAKVEQELKSNPDLDYDRRLNIDDPHHYLIDVLRNWRKMGREVTPGTFKRRMEALDLYNKPLKRIDYIGLYQKDPIFRAAIEFVLNITPSVVAEKDMKVTAQPFENKHTNVGYPWFRNDRAINSETGQKYALIALEKAENTSLKDTLHYPAAIIGRDQRAGWEQKNGKIIFKDNKARPVFAMSRVPNLQLSVLQSAETSAYQEQSVAFWGLKGSQQAIPLRKKNQLLIINNFSDYTEENIDVKAYDTSVSQDDIILRATIAYLKAKDALGKRTALMRAKMAYSVNYIDPRNGKVEKLQGRMASGFVDTNVGDGMIFLPKVIYNIMKQDRDWGKMAYSLIQKGGSPIEVMGDDCRLVHSKFKNKFDFDKFKNDMMMMNFEVHPQKGEFGTFFTQERTMKWEGKQVTIIPFPRAVSKTFWVERPKGLGPFGWTVATYMKLQPLLEIPVVFNAVVRMIVKSDKYKLGTHIPGKGDITFAQFMSELKKEDAIAQSENKIATKDKLWDGDPNKMGTFFESSGDFSKNFLNDIFKAVKGALSENK